MDKNDKAQKPLYIITGATDALGAVITRRLAQQGLPIIMACYNIDKATKMANQLSVETRNPDITAIHLDLGSFASVKQFVAALKALDRPVACLVNNASYISRRSEVSPDGYEKVVQVNFLSTVLLTLLVKPLMAEGQGHIVFGTPLQRSLVSIPYEFPQVNSFMPIAAFAQSKMALSLFSIYLSTVLRTSQIKVNGVDAGLLNLSRLRLSRWLDQFDISLPRHDGTGATHKGADTVLRAIGSGDTGFIFKANGTQVKTSTLLRNRQVFVKLCNDTMRLMKQIIDQPAEQQ